MIEAIIALGSNLGDRIANLNKAIEALKLVPGIKVTKISNFYETPPFEVPDKQDNYINCCIKVVTELSAHTLLGVCLGIEATMGRKRDFKFSSRVLDMDLLLYADYKYNTKELILPHPRMRERAFVIIPMCDLCENKVFYNFDFSNEFDKLDKAGIKLVCKK